MKENTELQRATIRLANEILPVLKRFKWGAESRYYVRQRVEECNRNRGGLLEIQKNDVYKILGESVTYFWGYSE